MEPSKRFSFAAERGMIGTSCKSRGLARRPPRGAGAGGVCRRGRFATAALLAAAALGFAAPAPACDLSLVLAVDASASVDEDEYALQTLGLANALRSPDVMSAILASGGVHISIFEWSGRWQQVMIVEWKELDTPVAILATAARIGANPRQYTEFPTSMGAALGFAQRIMERAPARCVRKVIDVSGDGVHNEGYGPRYAYKYYDFSNITVNGLVIRGATPDPLPFYYQEVLHGPDAFVEEAA
ncbi:MAG: DUF1194 domain-containing protein, partial [Paracoccaceae bacterium]